MLPEEVFRFCLLPFISWVERFDSLRHVNREWKQMVDDLTLEEYIDQNPVTCAIYKNSSVEMDSVRMDHDNGLVIWDHITDNIFKFQVSDVRKCEVEFEIYFQNESDCNICGFKLDYKQVECARIGDILERKGLSVLYVDCEPPDREPMTDAVWKYLFGAQSREIYRETLIDDAEFNGEEYDDNSDYENNNIIRFALQITSLRIQLYDMIDLISCISTRRHFFRRYNVIDNKARKEISRLPAQCQEKVLSVWQCYREKGFTFTLFNERFKWWSEQSDCNISWFLEQMKLLSFEDLTGLQNLFRWYRKRKKRSSDDSIAIKQESMKKMKPSTSLDSTHIIN